MKTHIEKEYKLLVSKEQFEHLLSHYPKQSAIKQTNTYYDNSNMDISNIHGAMRIREREGRYLFTLKKIIDKNLHEFECFVNENNTTAFESKEIKDVLAKYHINGPFSKLATSTTFRTIYETDDYELCFDINQFNDYIDYEIEYEYKREHDGRKNFNQILSVANLSYIENCTSKIARALHHLK